ncbi:hypothetical protein ABPG72_009050, partial [Tetrahymena utriculariae]
MIIAFQSDYTIKKSEKIKLTSSKKREQIPIQKTKEQLVQHDTQGVSKVLSQKKLDQSLQLENQTSIKKCIEKEQQTLTTNQSIKMSKQVLKQNNCCKLSSNQLDESINKQNLDSKQEQQTALICKLNETFEQEKQQGNFNLDEQNSVTNLKIKIINDQNLMNQNFQENSSQNQNIQQGQTHDELLEYEAVYFQDNFNYEPLKFDQDSCYLYTEDENASFQQFSKSSESQISKLLDVKEFSSYYSKLQNLIKQFQLETLNLNYHKKNQAESFDIFLGQYQSSSLKQQQIILIIRYDVDQKIIEKQVEIIQEFQEQQNSQKILIENFCFKDNSYIFILDYEGYSKITKQVPGFILDQEIHNQQWNEQKYKENIEKQLEQENKLNKSFKKKIDQIISKLKEQKYFLTLYFTQRWQGFIFKGYKQHQVNNNEDIIFIIYFITDKKPILYEESVIKQFENNTNDIKIQNFIKIDDETYILPLEKHVYKFYDTNQYSKNSEQKRIPELQDMNQYKIYLQDLINKSFKILTKQNFDEFTKLKDWNNKTLQIYQFQPFKITECLDSNSENEKRFQGISQELNQQQQKQLILFIVKFGSDKQQIDQEIQIIKAFEQQSNQEILIKYLSLSDDERVFILDQQEYFKIETQIPTLIQEVSKNNTTIKVWDEEQILKKYKLKLVKESDKIKQINDKLKFKVFKNKKNQIIKSLKEQKYLLTEYLTSGGEGVIFEGYQQIQIGQYDEFVFKVLFGVEEQNEIDDEIQIMKRFELNTNVIKFYNKIQVDKETTVLVLQKCKCSLSYELEQEDNYSVE